MAPPLIHYQYNNRKEIQSFGVPIVVHIMSSGLRILLFNTTDNNNASGVGGHYGGCGSRVAGDVAACGGISVFSSQQQTQTPQSTNTTVGDNSSVAAGGSSSVDGSSGGSGRGGGGGYGGLTGLMGRVLGAGSSSTTGGGGANLSSEFYLLCIVYSFRCDILFGRGAVEYL